MGRFELMAQHGRYQIFGMHMDTEQHRGYVKEWLLDDRNALLNAEKNIRAMRDICTQRQIGFYCAELDLPFPDDRGSARDLKHPGQRAHAEFADYMTQKLFKEKDNGS
jgi:hypothetical protein